MHTTEETAEQGLKVTRELIGGDVVKTPTPAMYAKIFAVLGKAAPSAEDLRSWGMPVRENTSAA
ncbi:hypothetical protein AB0I28_32665 [Phytomonospora sp. NPDC050363]|uniref:hypothetical protein n=1 Tax=Phytomonospora sp. NPDC050363 TaxID=3155642 RepID=UPI0033F0BFE6